MLINIVNPYIHVSKMEKIQFWLNDKQFKEAIRKLGDKSKLYGFAKKVFLEALKNV